MEVGTCSGAAGDANQGLSRVGHAKFSESFAQRRDVIIHGLKGPLWLWVESHLGEEQASRQRPRGGVWVGPHTAAGNGVILSIF